MLGDFDEGDMHEGFYISKKVWKIWQGVSRKSSEMSIGIFTQTLTWSGNVIYAENEPVTLPYHEDTRALETAPFDQEVDDPNKSSHIVIPNRSNVVTVDEVRNGMILSLSRSVPIFRSVQIRVIRPEPFGGLRKEELDGERCIDLSAYPAVCRLDLENPKTSVAMDRGFGTDPIRPVLHGGSRSDAEREQSSLIHGETKDANRTPNLGLGSSKQAGGHGQRLTEEANLESLTRELDFVPGTGIEEDKPLLVEAGEVESDVPLEAPMPLEKHPGGMSDSLGAETSPSASVPFKESSTQASYITGRLVVISPANEKNTLTMISQTDEVPTAGNISDAQGLTEYFELRQR